MKRGLLLIVLLASVLACGGPAAGQTLEASSAVRSDGALRLTTPPTGASDQNPAFSPDGARLVLTRFENGYNVGPAGLFLLDLASGAVTRLTPWEDQDNVNLPGAAWIALTPTPRPGGHPPPPLPPGGREGGGPGGGGEGRIVFASDRLDADDLWRIAPDGSDFSRITTHSGPPWYIEPSWSPDGEWIVFEADDDVPDDQQQGGIWKVRADGSDLTPLTGPSSPLHAGGTEGGPSPLHAGGTEGGPFDDRQPNWSPAGDRILFQRHVPGSDDWNIYTIAPDGSDLRQVTTSPASDTDASWSPDGACIVYSSDHGGLPTPNIFVIPAEGGAPARVTHDDSHEDGAPSWSPDGTWIAFESHVGQDEETPASLWRIAVTEATCENVPETCQICLPLVFKNRSGAAPGWWQPPVGASWQWQLSDLPVDTSFDVDVYDLDLFENDAATVAALHAQGRKAICYISVGSWEEWRPDADQFPASVLGNDYEGWPGEKWLDIRQIDLLAPIMRARLGQCQAKGFDGVEPDNIDGYTNDTGFPLTYQDQLIYNRWLADEAHARGLSIGLKNDDEQVADLLAAYDWALTEDCFAQDWCGEVAPFVAAGKAVFAAEYTDELTLAQFLEEVCPQAGALGFSAILKHRDLDAWRRACP